MTKKFFDYIEIHTLFVPLRAMLPQEAMDLEMKINDDIRTALESDLGLNVQFSKGLLIPVKNCWHFSTDGNQVDFMFNDDDDFITGMNRLFITVRKYRVVILAFSLMGTHLHLVLWGEFRDVQRFVFEYLKLTSMYLSGKYGDKHKLVNLFPNHQAVDNDRYLKTVICYVVKNAPVGGVAFNALEYPWSSGPLYFRRDGYWSSCNWGRMMQDSSIHGTHELRKMLRTKVLPKEPFRLIGRMVFPGEYVASDIVESIYRTHKAFNYFMCISKESEVESRQGAISRLSLPHYELQQHKNELCVEQFGARTIRVLSTTQRLSLAKTLLARYNCSPKQVAKSCGLKFEEVREML